MSDAMREYREGFVGNANPHGGLRLMSVTLHHEIEGWWAESSDVPNWSGAAPSYEDMAEVCAEVAKMYGFNGWVANMPPEPTLDVGPSPSSSAGPDQS